MQKTNPGRYTGNIKVNSTSTRSGKKYEFIASDSSGKQLFNLNVEDSRKTNLGTGDGSSSSVDDSNGWKLTSNGDQPMLIWVGKERGRMVTANIAPHYDVPGMYVGAYMNEKSVRGQSADFIASQLKLPQVPIGVLNDFTKMASKFWSTQAGEVVNSKTLNIPKNALVFGETINGMSISWSGIDFPKSGKYADAIMTTNIIFDYINIKAKFTPMVNQKGRTLNKPISYEIRLKKDIVQSMIDEISSKMEYLSRNLQQLNSQAYNPNQVFLNDITITDKGEVIWNDYNLSDGKVTQIMLSMISAENRRLEKVTNKPDITLPKKQAEVVEFINRMIDIDLGPYLREPKKLDVVLFDSSELSINQLNNIERLGRETGKWSLQPNGGMGHALFLNVW
jgi:hypothetical protein